jgi:hypothetical protein
VDPRRFRLVWFLRLKVGVGLLAALGLFRDTKVLVDNGDEHLQHND